MNSISAYILIIIVLISHSIMIWRNKKIYRYASFCAPLPIHMQHGNWHIVGAFMSIDFLTNARITFLWFYLGIMDVVRGFRWNLECQVSYIPSTEWNFYQLDRVDWLNYSYKACSETNLMWMTNCQNKLVRIVWSRDNLYMS